MVDPRDILRFTDEIARQFKPRNIILFGSYAYGKPNEDSDVDVLVVMRHAGVTELKKATQICMAVHRNFPCDLLVRSPRVLAQRLGWHDFFLMEIMERGICLHDATDKRVGIQGRRRLLRRSSAVSGSQVAAL